MKFPYALMILCSAGFALAESPPSRAPVVVELFTSQGCNSCPPADALLGELAKRSDVVALAFHVDYWDSLGWRDRFGIPEAVERQRRYAQTLPHGSVFTPQVVVDGMSSLLGTDRRGIDAHIAATTNTNPLKLEVGASALTVVLAERPYTAAHDVYLVTLVSAASTPVGRGENAGRTLKDFNVVRTFRRLGGWAGESNALSVARASLPADADQVAVLVQQVGQGAVIGAARADLRE